MAVDNKYCALIPNNELHRRVKVLDSVEARVIKVKEDGKLDLFITDENGEHSYEGHNIPTSEFTVTLSKAGQYKIRVEAKDHKGSYKINWDIKK